ncbi:MAG: glycosyltransferase, partial [Maribacter sp.]
ASGKPFIASDVPGLTDVVKNAGILFPLGDEKKLAEIIERLKNDRDFYEYIGQRGLERSQLFDINIMLDEYLELYKECDLKI